MFLLSAPLDARVTVGKLTWLAFYVIMLCTYSTCQSYHFYLGNG